MPTTRAGFASPTCARSAHQSARHDSSRRFVWVCRNRSVNRFAFAVSALVGVQAFATRRSQLGAVRWLGFDSSADLGTVNFTRVNYPCGAGASTCRQAATRPRNAGTG